MLRDGRATTDPVRGALEDLVEALRDNLAANAAAIERARMIIEMRNRGLPYREIADEAGRPLVIELVNENTQRLHTYGSRLRRAQAAALHDEGMTMEQIAELFGVTRQRVSAILRNPPEARDEEEAMNGDV